ncbi:MAG: hypothetical protein D8M58_17475 [Calditrichaeota bacterium]|nr:MAG: hypothetical protein DWQ03_01390 [Calditrichota bacterium]MBL1207198.1 hypothetical protein [Calditrichota bacterium]NOG47031.1 hypothetical protein [Calditrichota bacterium]
MEENKICQSCNARNRIDAKFCDECGNELLLGEDKKKCENCDFPNNDDSKFCFKCGEKFKQKEIPKKLKQKQQNREARGKKQVQTKQSSQPLKIVLIAVVAIAAYFLAFNDNQPQTAQRTVQTSRIVEQKLADPVMETAAMDIASKFICSCGTCGEQPLNTCTCEVAQTERQFIRNGLQNKMDQETIIKSVNSKYGWIKPEFAAQYGPGKFKLGSNQKTLLTPGLDIMAQKNEMKVASFADRQAIISSFACTCGQCQIDELKDCSCNHPGGAIEVKKYIDQKIQEEKYTKENIIQLVEAQYGARIR